MPADGSWQSGLFFGSPADNLGGLRYLVMNEVFTLVHLVLVKMLGGEFAAIQIVYPRLEQFGCVAALAGLARGRANLWPDASSAGA